MTSPGLGAYGTLGVCGAGWGLTQPLNKIALDAGYAPLTILVWQFVLIPLVLAPFALRLPRPGRLRPALGMVAFVGLFGTAIPNGASYVALSVLPSGIVSILLSLIPALALPMAIAFGLERLAARRLLGLAIGLAGTLLLVAPGAEGSVALRLLPLGLIAPALYAFHNVIVGRFGTGGLHPVQLMFAGSLLALPLTALVALALGTPLMPTALGLPEAAAVLSAIVHAAVFTTFYALVTRAGSIFSTQVSYLVTLFGVLWAMLLLGERYGIAVWAALALIFAGISLVRPHVSARPAPAGRPPARA